MIIDGTRYADDTVEHSLGAHIKAGRALLAVVPIGGRERPREPGFEWPDRGSVRYREQVIRYATEFSLGLDYLATRDDIDLDRLAFVGTSWGATGAGIIMAAVERRYRSVVFVANRLAAAATI